MSIGLDVPEPTVTEAEMVPSNEVPVVIQADDFDTGIVV